MRFLSRSTVRPNRTEIASLYTRESTSVTKNSQKIGVNGQLQRCMTLVVHGIKHCNNK